MFRKQFFLFISIFLFNFSTSFSQYVIKGTVTGYDKQPMIRADIFLISNETHFPRPIIKSYKVSSDGSFLINLNRPGVHRFRITGVHHRHYELPIYLDTPDEVIIDIKLAAIQYKEQIDSVGFRVDYDLETRKYRDRLDVKTNQDGIFVAEFETTDSLLTYYLSRIDKGWHGVNGLQADYFIPDGHDYLAVLKTNPDSVITIKFDPNELIRSEEPESYKFIRSPEKTYKFSIIHNDYTQRYQDYRDHNEEGRRKGIYDNDYANNYGWKKDFKELDKLIKTEKDPFLRQGWFISRLQIALSDAWAKPRAKISKKLAENALREIPPDSPLWSYHPNTLSAAIGYAGEIKKSFNEVEKEHYFMQSHGKPFLAYINKAVASHPDSSIYRHILGSAIRNAYKFQEYDLFDKYYKEYMEIFAGTPGADSFEKRYSPTRRIKPGKPVPKFSFESLDDPNIKLTSEDLVGKNYIIDFWGTWCGPCKPTLEALTRIYNEFKGPDFEMISVSICFQKKDAIKFRKEKIPMPCFNTHIDNWKPKQGVLYDFEVVGIPKVILVDKKGFIKEVYDLENMVEILRNN
jgi:thiol-disulfide isomerase/thioredoxin